MVIRGYLLVLALVVAGCSSSGDDSIATADAPAFTEPIVGFESWGDAIELRDGRLLAKGRSTADDGIEGWSQRNTDAVAPGELVPPIVANQTLPVRLFVYDPNGETLTAVSHWPESRRYSTAISRGLGPDHVLHALILGGDRTVAYTVGFNGAGYDVPHWLYLAPIPPLT